MMPDVWITVFVVGTGVAIFIVLIALVVMVALILEDELRERSARVRRTDRGRSNTRS